MYSRNIKIYPATGIPKATPLKENLDLSNTTDIDTSNQNIITNTDKGDEPMTEKEVAALKEELSNAKDKIETLTEKCKILTESKALSENKVKELTESNTVLEAKVKELTEAKDNEIKLREGAETALAEAKKDIRHQLEQTVNIIRTSIGKEAFSEDVISRRSDDSLKDSIMDLKEEFDMSIKAKSAKPKVPEKVASSGLVNPDDDNKKTGTKLRENKDAKEKQINLKEGFQAIFNDVFSAHQR